MKKIWNDLIYKIYTKFTNHSYKSVIQNVLKKELLKIKKAKNTCFYQTKYFQRTNPMWLRFLYTFLQQNNFTRIFIIAFLLKILKVSTTTFPEKILVTGKCQPGSIVTANHPFLYKQTLHTFLF